MLRQSAVPRRIAVALLVLASALTAGCDDSPAHKSEGHAGGVEARARSGYQGTAADFAEIGRLLRERARAIEQGDRAAFLRGLDPGNTGLRRRQLELFENLQDLPLASIRYQPDDFGGNGEPVAGQDPTLRPDIIEIVRLRDVDRRAVANDVDMTFVRRHGHWVLGVEKAETEDTPLSNQVSRPWYGTRIDVARRGPLVVLTDHQTPSVSEELADLTDRNLVSIDAFLGIPVDRAVLIDATSTGYGTRMTSEGLEAAGVMFPVSSPDGMHLAGWRIKVNPHEVKRLLDDTQLFRHELTHFATKQLIRVAPHWLTEGLAEYVGWLPYQYSQLRVSDSWAAAFRSAKPAIPGVADFAADPRLSYPISHVAVTVLMNDRGISGIKDLLKAYERAAEGTRDTEAEWATDMVLRRVYGFGEAELARRTWALIEQVV